MRPFIPHHPDFLKKEYNPHTLESDIPASLVMVYKENNLDPLRRRNLDFCIDYYNSTFPKIQIVLVEQCEQVPTVSSNLVKKVNLHASGVFNKSKILNLGWRAADHENLIFCDADIILNKATVFQSLELLKKFDIIKPTLFLHNLTKTDSVQDVDFTRMDSYWIRGFYNPVCGAAFVTTKSFYYKFGGFDEAFEGHGGEDDAASIKAVFSGKAVAFSGKAIHLYHEIAAHTQPNHSAEYARNLSLLSQIKEKSDKELADYIKAGQAKLDLL